MDAQISFTVGQWISNLFWVLLVPALVSALIYFIVRWLKRWLRATPIPLAALAFILVLVLPSLPSIAERYKFRQDVMNEASYPWVRLPWFNCSLLYFEALATFLFPLDWAILVSPESSSSSRFNYAIYQLDEDPRVFLVEPDCDAGTLQDNTGAIREMASDESKVLCSDWTKEKQALKAKESGETQTKRAELPCGL